MELAALQGLIDRASGRRVVCVGDVMVDRFVYGSVTRMSPEAPIPILARNRELVMLGASGNVARNVSALGGQVVLVGVIGSDIEGREVLRLVGDDGGIEGALVTDTARPTTLKTRFVSGGQQLLRVDVEETQPITGDTDARVCRMIRDVGPGAGVIILSDYGKGVVTDDVIRACRQTGAPVIVDSKARSFRRYGPVDVIKPNAAELSHATGLPTGSDGEVEAALARALDLCEARAILVTRAAQGMSLAIRGRPVLHFPGSPREVYDVSGAGDTAIAALGLGIAAGGNLEEAVSLALLASGVAVGKVGTATVTPEELIEASLAAHMAAAEAKIATPARMVEEVARWRARGLRVGFTNGCFDILHRGHVAYLAQARSWCDRLIVGVNSDRSIRVLKGEGRPVNDLESRALVLAGLASVDLVAPFDADTPIELIRAARPDVIVKGADYAESEVVGGDLVRGWGGEVRLAPLVEGYSTTAAILRMAGEGRT
ncbi:MAG: D-glycero-beta-D-manno-heptose 1-phosphate adenylyltransferase [Phenylobacterium sp.]